MSIFSPALFSIPNSQWADEIHCPPYDVLSLNECKSLATSSPINFIHLIRPDWKDGKHSLGPNELHIDANALINSWLMQYWSDLSKDAFLVYQVSKGNFIQTGLVGLVDLRAYEDGRVKKHELIRPEKLVDRQTHFELANAQTEAVLLMAEFETELSQLLAQYTVNQPEFSINSADGYTHKLWVVDSLEHCSLIKDSFERQNVMYIADGHHRTEASYRAAQKNIKAKGLLAGVFNTHELKILPYHRVVTWHHTEFIDFINNSTQWLLEKTDKAYFSTQLGQYGLMMNGNSYILTLKKVLEKGDLPSSLLFENLLKPIGIIDEKTDKRLNYLGGEPENVISKCKKEYPEEILITLPPVEVQQVMHYADLGQIMPPKSTWFDPKIESGLFMYRYV